jgi:hypothetical protein
VTLDAEVGRSSSSRVALVEGAVARDADAIVVELGTNDFSPAPFRGYPIQSLDILASVPLVMADGRRSRGRREHPGGQRGDPRDRADLPQRRDRRLGSLLAGGGLAGGRDPPLRGFERLGSELLVPMLSAWRDTLIGRGATSCGQKVVRGTS